MTYFTEHYDDLRFPIARERGEGFRLAQIAAAQAVSAHFFASKEPAIVTMPTGAGKTTVLIALAFMLRATRVLVLTPSRLVREQIAENFAALVDLKKIQALPLELPGPAVFATAGAIRSAEEWENLRRYDVVVATVPSVSPREGGVAEPPQDLFDLVLVDEAHHSPAKTWSRLLSIFSNSRQVLFSATPFRRDDKEIRGRFVFTYDLRRAYEDRVFGEINFEPVIAHDGQQVDVAIALATERKFRRDRDAGFNHLVMVRASTLTRAGELAEVYEQHTRLRLAFVNGQHGLRHVKRIIEQLRANQLDGVICVNMFGEGFNLPSLKIAAVHSPHKSLAVTLQFIGRFARAGEANIGGATFLAEPASSSAEIGELYEAGAIWRDIVQNLAEGRIAEEQRNREVLDSFVVEAVPDMGDFSLYTVRPYFHAKVYAAPPETNISIEPNFPEKLQVLYKGTSEPHGATIYITREAIRSPWSTDDRFNNVAYDIFVFHYNANAGLLFICASRRNSRLYSRLATPLVGGRPRPVSQASINRSLLDLEAMEFFSVGMRKRHRLGRVESYRMMTGQSVDKGIQAADSRIFDRGHCFGKGIEDGSEVTIGVSSSSKVWSNTYDQIPELLNWCNQLAAKIASGRPAITGSGIDQLQTGIELTSVPGNIIAVAWNPSVYRDPPLVFFNDEDGNLVEVQLLNFDIAIVGSREGEVTFSIRGSEQEWIGRFSLNQSMLIEPVDENMPEMFVHTNNEDIPLADFLNEEMPCFYTSDLSCIEGQSMFPVPQDLNLMPDDAFEVVPWDEQKVDIQKEKPGNGDRRSIFEWVEQRLLESEAQIVFCDDGSGEIADFISIHAEGDARRIAFYHCKASGAPRPGARVADLYDVCGQAVKSSMWLRCDQFLERLSHRNALQGVRGYLRGDDDIVSTLLAPEARRNLQYEVCVVQPGINSRARGEHVSQLLSAANDYLIQGGIERFRVICS